MVLWGSKASLSLTLSSVNMCDRKLQPDGKLYRDPSPRPTMTTQLAQERLGNREEDWRRERDTEKHNARSNDTDPRERYYKKDRATAPGWREGERERLERERKLAEDKGRVRAVKNVQRYIEREMERGMKKGDTFPRMANNYSDHGRRKMSDATNDDDRWEKRKREKQRLTGWPKDEIQIKAAKEGKSPGRTPVEDYKLRPRERYELDPSMHDRRREVGDSWEMRERYAVRTRDKGGKGGQSLSPHKQRARETDAGRSDREKAQRSGQSRDTRREGDSVERETRRERVRDPEKENGKGDGGSTGKSVWEGDRDRRGYKEDNGQRHGDKERERQVDQSRRREVEKDREIYRDVEKREGEKRKARERRAGSNDDRALLKDREDYERPREYRRIERKGKDRKERETELIWDETGVQTCVRAPRAPPRSLSSDMGSDATHRRHRGGSEPRESARDDANNNKRDAERSQIKLKTSERHESDTGEVPGTMPAQRRMWLEPQRDKNSKEDFSERDRYKLQKERRREEESMESQATWVREGRQGKLDLMDQYNCRGRHEGRNEYRGQTEGETEEVSVDGDDVDEVLGDNEKADGNGSTDRRSTESDDTGETVADTTGETVADTTEEHDREERSGSECFTRAGSDKGKLKNDRTMSAEEFVTVSSNGGDDDDDEREEDEDEAFEDSREPWENAPNGSSPVDLQICETEEEPAMGKEDGVGEKQPTYVFCVIGQSLPQSGSGDTSHSQVDQEGEMCNHCSGDATPRPLGDPYLTLSRNDEYLTIREQNKEDEREQSTSAEERTAAGGTAEADIACTSPAALHGTEAVEDTRSKVETTRSVGDLQTERLLVQWRQKNKELAEDRRNPPSPVPCNPYADVHSEVNLKQVLDEINAGVVGSSDNTEAACVQMGKGWTMCEEPKRHSQAPHLKWAKNVVRDILGHSEEENADELHFKDPRISETRGDARGEEELAHGTKDIPIITLTANEQNSDPELHEDDSLEELRGMQQRQGGTHSEQFRALCDDTLTHTHADTPPYTEGKEDDNVDKETGPSGGRLHLDTADVEVKITYESGSEALAEKESEGVGQKEAEMYLSIGNTLYKPNSCPSLHCESTPETLSREGQNQDRKGSSEEEMQGEESEGGLTEPLSKQVEVVEEGEIDVGPLSSSLRESGWEAAMLRGGIRNTAERRDAKPHEEDEEEGVGRDRRTRIFSTTDDEEDLTKSWGGEELTTRFGPFTRQKRKSKFFKRAQLYQQYNEAAQNLEILTQSGSHAHRLPEYGSQSPAPPQARRPLPALPSILHPHSIFHSSSFSSIRSLPPPEPAKNEGRPPSPRLSLSFTQSSALWQDLPGVRTNCKLGELTEEQRRLQEVQFEVVTSEASYCQSLDIVVEHFVKSKQLGALLTSQDRNWLFSRLSDVRAISHSFLSKLEERVESDIMHFTVCDIIAQHCPRFKKVYVPYLTNQSYQDATYQRLMNENPGFKRVVEKLERNPVCERLPFRSFLVLPFQRITRIKLLVQNIVKRTTPGTAEATQAIKAMKLLERLIQESNDSISQMKNIESLVSLNAKVDFECKTLPLVSQSRRLIREGPVTELMDFSKKDTERNAYLHLFNDFLLVSLQKEGGRFTVIDHCPVTELRVENCRVKLDTYHKNLFRLHTANRSLLLSSETQSDKLRWLSALSRPYPEVDFSAAQDMPQMQCIRAFVAQQPDELSLDKADIILVHQNRDNWVEGTRLPDRHRGWVPESNLETISNAIVRQRNLLDALKLTTATAAVSGRLSGP